MGMEMANPWLVGFQSVLGGQSVSRVHEQSLPQHNVADQLPFLARTSPAITGRMSMSD